MSKRFSSAYKKVLANAVENLREATPVDTGEARDGWKVEDGKIVNNVPHIRQLNDGSSTQAPAFFVERALLQTPGVVVSGTIVDRT